jgi:hypothetical protein
MSKSAHSTTDRTSWWLLLLTALALLALYPLRLAVLAWELDMARAMGFTK